MGTFPLSRKKRMDSSVMCVLIIENHHLFYSQNAKCSWITVGPVSLQVSIAAANITTAVAMPIGQPYGRDPTV